MIVHANNVQKRFRIHWIAEAITPYNDYLFKSLSEEPDIDLTVHYRISNADLYYWDLLPEKGYRYRIFKKTMGLDLVLLGLPFSEPNAFYILTGIKGPTKTLLVFVMSAFKRNYAFWTDTPPDGYFHSLRGLLRKFVFSFIFNRATKILTTGKPGKQFFINEGVSSGRIADLPFFWDLALPRFQNSDCEKANGLFTQYVQPGDFVFALSGKLVDSKRFDIAVEAAFELLKRTGRSDIKFLVAGEGPLRKHIESLIAKQGLRRNFFLLGWLDGVFLHRFFENCDVFLHTALIDPFPTVVLKAMTYGKPILGFEGAGSVTDRVEDGTSGFVIETANISRLVECMEFCVSSRTRCAEMGRMSRLKAEEWPVSRGIQCIKNIGFPSEAKH